MAEKNLWTYVRDAMRGMWHAQRHEDRAGKGIADVSYGMDGVCGWVELKWSREWPSRATSAVPLPHFTTEQRIWLSKRIRHARHVYVLWQIGNEYLLFNSEEAFDLLGHVTRDKVVGLAIRHWRGGIDWDDLRGVLGK